LYGQSTHGLIVHLSAVVQGKFLMRGEPFSDALE
jgi:hypothetical protein